MATVDFYFDFVSPYSYLAHTQMADMLKRTNGEVVYKPILLGALHKIHDVQSPAFLPVKAQWVVKDCKLWANHYGVTLKWSKTFPFNSLFFQRAAAYVQKNLPEKLDLFVTATFKALWEDGLDPMNQEAIAAHIQSLDIDPQAVLAGTQQGEIKDVIKANTNEAKEIGLFGAPGFKIGEHVLFGQDRLIFVEAALKGELPNV